MKEYVIAFKGDRRATGEEELKETITELLNQGFDSRLIKAYEIVKVVDWGYEPKVTINAPEPIDEETDWDDWDDDWDDEDDEDDAWLNDTWTTEE